MKTIKIFDTRTSKTYSIEVEGQPETWGDIEGIIEEESSFDMDRVKFIEKESRTEYSSPQAILPEADTIVFFVYPKDTKAGEGLPERYRGKKGVATVKKMTSSNLKRTVRKLNAKGILDIDADRPADEVRVAFIHAIKNHDVLEVSSAGDGYVENENIEIGSGFQKELSLHLRPIREELSQIRQRVEQLYELVDNSITDKETEEFIKESQRITVRG